MTDALTLRGPDDHGIWADPELRIALGHRRLSILDLSPLGHQPMASPSGRFQIVFNGEIYNYRDLKSELDTFGYQFRGGSDTEVMLAAFEQWGIADALKRFTGMFAFALWDRKCRQLTLARDRAGEKPLYYGWNSRRFVVASELKAISACSGLQLEIDRSALCALMRHGYVSAPWSIYRGIFKLLPGSLLTLSADHLASSPQSFSPWPEEAGKSPRPEWYWQAPPPVTSSERDVPYPDALDELERLLSRAVRDQMIADVPLGAFLSGGIDSSLVVALMQRESTQPVRTFSIGFHEQAFNEAHHAKEVARYLGTDHTELYVTPEETMQVIPQLPEFYDEPFADSSQIPTFLVSKLARGAVTVSLSGDGGDELFGGYSRYLRADKLRRSMETLPSMLKRPLAGALTLLQPEQIDSLYQGSVILPKLLKFRAPGRKMHRFASILQNSSLPDLYRELLSHWNPPEQALQDSQEPETLLTRMAAQPFDQAQQWMMYADLRTYLADDILVKVDRASMAVSLESRAPLLDYRVIEFARRLPVQFKISAGRTKIILRALLDRFVPAHLIERPKMGFAVPVGVWLRGPMRGWAEDLLEPGRLNQEGYFNPAAVQARWQDHLRGTRDWTDELWDVLMFQAWLRR